ncbi:MAG: DUF4399 domain-containing protein [Nitrosospira sp.]|nr:DUF4399 domain-containing protein [Nitrosospira sp.]MBI0414888.1 DUF4399 domain-containing protein [Nitrosospira sp.]MBI0415954.1 DUF4399 domain-containing protein [Nitrosospira sp.]MBI0417356.1 DUF4399 domain-containing protein [Nitrosospira sp.]MBI0418743.1 DUF4399 domain-containing protein [Nitrosospira sp.]
MIMRSYALLVPIIFILFTTSVSAQSVDFFEPKNDTTVISPFKVVFMISGMTIAPSGDMTVNTGHHHLLIDTEDIANGIVIPKDDTHKHFGQGQTETEITLLPGKHKLSLQFANGAHQSYGEKLSKTIEITVK